METKNCEKFQNEINNVFNKKSKELDSELENITKELELDTKEMEEGAPDTSGPGVVFDIDLDVKMVEHSIKLHLPSVNIKDEKLSLHVPQVEMKNKEIIFHTPSTRMVRKRTGSHPETKCTKKYKKIKVGGFTRKIPYPHCTTTWKPIYTDVPEVFMQEQKIVFGYPEVKMKLTEFTMGIPEFSMEPREIKFHLPSITIKRISAEVREMERKAKELEGEYSERTETALEDFRHELGEDISEPHTELFVCLRGNIEYNRDQALKDVDVVINSLSAGIKQLKENDTDSDNEYLQSLEKERSNLLREREKIVGEFDGALSSLEVSQQESLNQILSGIHADS